jgi:6-phosphogluconolactonase
LPSKVRTCLGIRTIAKQDNIQNRFPHGTTFHLPLAALVNPVFHSPVKTSLTRNLLATGLAALLPVLGNAATFFTYVGTYTGPKSQGIYQYSLDAETGKLTPAGLAAEIKDPTFLAIHPSQKFLYSLSETSGPKGGSVTAFALDAATGKLTRLNQQSTGGNGPCHLTVDKTGQCLLVANYGGGSIASLPIQKDGSLSEAASFIQHQGSSVNRQRQQGPHAHWIGTDRANRLALVCDLGLDRVLFYQLDTAKATLTPADPPFTATAPGAGPRHIAWHPSGNFAYVINEMGNTIAAYRYDAKAGRLEEIQTVPTLPADFTGQSTTAEIEFHPNGTFLYGSNRGHDSIAVYSVDAATGKLTLVQHQLSGGKMPRNFAIDPTGRWLLAGHQISGNLVVFKVDSKTGKLAPTGQEVQVPAVCLKFVAARPTP